MYGNDVDSIRIVDPETQLSERKLLQVTIIPNVDTQFSSEERISLFDFLPDNTIVWLQDYELCKSHLADSEDDLQAFLGLQEEIKASFLANTTLAGQKAAKRKEQEDLDDKLIKKMLVPAIL